MNASGLFFLTTRPSLVLLQSPEGGVERRAWRFNTLERIKRGVQEVHVFWEGTEGAAFVQANAKSLIKGCALNLCLERVRPLETRDGLRGFITSCSLAPERWPTYHAEPRIDSPQQPRPLAA